MKTRLTLSTVCLLCCAACSSFSVGTAPRTTASVTTTIAPAAESVSVTLTVEQISAVRAHYASNDRGNRRGNGRGRNGGLPPGIARNLERGKPLPPGIAKQYLPADVLVRLPTLDDGLDYVIAAGKLLLVEAATEVVREVLIDVLV